jgi:hypothetical protein
MLDINEMTFGIELEITLPAGTIAAGGYHNGRSIPGFPAGWNAQSDGSIAPTIPGHQGVEIVSGVLRGPTGLAEIADVVARLNAMGGRVNRSCGFHVHIGMPRDVIDRIGNLTFLMANLEKAFYASTGTKNRERNAYSASIKATPHVRNLNYEAAAAQRSAAALVTPRSAGGHISHPQRMQTLNLTNILNGSRQAVEFRVFAGTLNLQKIVASVRMCLAIVQKATDGRRRVEWEPAARLGPDGSPIQPTGKEEIHRFMYRMGWHRGGTTNGFTYGNLQSDHVGGIEESKRILGKMAAKYDEAE